MTESNVAQKKRVLILCTGNSCRSQMAQGFVEADGGDRWEAFSAGTAPAERVHPLAIAAMAEVGIDISNAVPEPVSRYLDDPWDVVVTVCDAASESCPAFPRPIPTLHVSFPDPAAATGDPEAVMAVFRQVRDDIRARIRAAIEGLEPQGR